MKVIPVITECPNCGKQALIKLSTKLPHGYDDPEHPIMQVPLRDALIYEIKVYWPEKEETDERKIK